MILKSDFVQQISLNLVGSYSIFTGTDGASIGGFETLRETQFSNSITRIRLVTRQTA